MVKRYVLLYVLVEMAVLIALTATVGLGWTLLALVAAFTLGLLLAGSQIRRQVAQLRRGLTDPGAQATDSALVALGSVLVFIPGLVTTAAGLLLLAPPSRSAVRPMATGLVTRGLTRRVASSGRPMISSWGTTPAWVWSSSHRGGATSTARSWTCPMSTVRRSPTCRCCAPVRNSGLRLRHSVTR